MARAVSEEMQAYSDERSDAWHEGDRAETLRENLDQVNEMLGQIDDLRSQF